MSSVYRFNLRSLTQFGRRSASVLWLVVAAIYLSILAGRAVYRNYQSQRQTISLRQQLVSAQQEQERLQALIVYYQTDAYREKELRRAMLLKQPDERVYALPEYSEPISLDDDRQLSTPAVAPSTPTASTLPIWRQWYNYVRFGRHA